MKQYTTALPRVTLGLAALAMTAVSLGSLIVLPSRMETGSQTFATVLASATSDARGAEIAIAPACITVVGTREQETTLQPPLPQAAKPGDQV